MYTLFVFDELREFALLISRSDAIAAHVVGSWIALDMALVTAFVPT